MTSTFDKTFDLSHIDSIKDQLQQPDVDFDVARKCQALNELGALYELTGDKPAAVSCYHMVIEALEFVLEDPTHSQAAELARLNRVAIGRSDDLCAQMAKRAVSEDAALDLLAEMIMAKPF